MNGIIIVNQNLGHNKYKIERFYEECNKMGISLQTFVNDGTLGYIENESIVLNIPKVDFVIYLDKDIYLARLLETYGYRLFNNADFIRACDDKFLTFVECSNKGIKMPKTIAAPLIYKDLTDENLLFLDYVIKELNLPMIVKKNFSSLGEGVYLVNSKVELVNLYKQIYKEPIIFQKYIETSKGKTLRILVIDKEIVGGFIRYNDNDFRSNFGETANGKTLENADKYFDFAKIIADKLNIEYAGIDLLLGENNEPILCEINSNAFFEEFEKVTGINVAKKFIEMIEFKVR